jgi:pimeloyl-ACP methyl ester carboxylesterase
VAHFTSSGFDIAFDDLGPRDSGRPLILIHGFSSNRNENWRRVGWYGALERRRVRFAALDCRGHGESAKPHDPAAYTRDEMVGDVFALMNHLNIERANLMGYSMGAYLAMAATLAKPERIGDLILGGIGGAMFGPPRPNAPLVEAMEAENIDAISDPLAKSFRQFADDQGEDRLALAACAKARAEPIAGSVSDIKVPTLVVAGARDELAGDPQELAARIPGARAVTLSGCDHFSAIPHALFKAAVFDFLDGTLD